MSRSRTLKGIAAAATIAAVAVVTLGAAGGQTPGPPLTKEEYFQKSLEVYTAVTKTNGPYYAVSLDPLPPKKCARKVRLLAKATAAAAAIAASVTPPAEIAGIHNRLVKAGQGLARGFRRVAKPVLAGRLACGDNTAGGRIDDLYYRSPVDELEAKLRKLGYVPSGY